MTETDIKWYNIWERTGLLEGLSPVHKKKCSLAFTSVYLYTTVNLKDKNSCIELKGKRKFNTHHLRDQQNISISMIKQIFESMKETLVFDFNIMLYPLVRRIIRTNKEFSMVRLESHIQNAVKHFDVSRYSVFDDVEAEFVVFLAETY